MQQHFGIHIRRMRGVGIRVAERSAEDDNNIGQNVDLRCVREESLDLIDFPSASTSRNVNITNRNQNSSDERKSILVRIKRMDEKN